MKNRVFFLLCMWQILCHRNVVCVAGDRETCDRNCLGNPQVDWPPRGFVDSERTIRCSLRCLESDNTTCFQECLAQLGATCPNPTVSPAASLHFSLVKFNEVISRSKIGYCVSASGRSTEGINSSQLLPELVTNKLPDNNFQVSIPGTVVKNTSSYHYLVLENLSTNQTAFVALNASAAIVDLSEFVCDKVMILYAVDFDLQNLPLTSQSTQLTITAPVPNNLQIEFEENFEFVRHAILNISWTPLDPDKFCQYRVTLKPISNVQDETCSSQSSISVFVNKFESSLVLGESGKNESSAPLYDCMYNVMVETFPGGDFASEVADIRYNGPRSVLTVSCEAVLNTSSNDYNIVANWSVSDPRAAEAIEAYKVVLKRSRFAGNIESIDEFPATSISNTSVTYSGLNFLREDGFYVVVVFAHRLPDENIFNYREPLFPSIFESKCNDTPAPPRMPDPVTMVTIVDSVFVDNKLMLTLNWTLPDFYNEEIRRIEIQVLSDSGKLVKTVLKTIVTDEAITSETTMIPESEISNISNTTIYVQIRIKDGEDLYSNWSRLSSLALAQVRVVTSATPTDSMDVVRYGGLPTYAEALIGIVVSCSLIGCVVCFIILYLKLKHRKKKQLIERSPSAMVILPRTSSLKRWPGILQPLQSTFYLDAWEVAPEDITVYEDSVLGKGFFGEVHKGQISGRSQKGGSIRGKRGSIRGVKAPRFSLTSIVAIKRLQSHADQQEKSNFLKEIELMKKVSGNDNDLSKFVVNMVGCVTTKEPMMLVLEFMKYGNLLEYLRYVRNRKIKGEITKPAPYLECDGAYSQLPPTSKYDTLGNVEEENLLEFARQIAAGMEYLSGLGIIHRDLACRNILLGEDRNLKISDFGYSRQLSPDDIYVITSHGVLPIRWMSIESLFHREFTSASDVWSYGVVLWEITTLGAHPYPNFTNEDIARELRRGYRMRRPENCSTDVYDKMLYCWSENPSERPTFSQLRKEFDRFLSVHMQDRYPYIEIEVTQPCHYDELAPETGQRRASASSGEMKTINLSDEDNDDVGLLHNERSNEIPQKTKSKTSILSSSTFFFDEEEKAHVTEILKEAENIGPTNTYDKLHPADDISRGAYDNLSPIPNSSNKFPHVSEKVTAKDPDHEGAIASTHNAYDSLSPITPGSGTQGAEKLDSEAQSSVGNSVDKREESLTNSSTSRSSFTDELLYHFERRLSDLGPRSKYPCLQKLERSVTSGAYDALEKKARDKRQGSKKKEKHHDGLGRKRIVRAGGKRWRRQGGHFESSDLTKGKNAVMLEERGVENREASDFPKITVLKSTYDTLEPPGSDHMNHPYYDSLLPHQFDTLDV